MVLKISSVQKSFPGFAIKGPDMQTAALAEKTQSCPKQLFANLVLDRL